MSTTRRARIAISAAAFAVLGWAAPVAAHAELDGSSHSACSIAVGGETIVLEFSEELAPGSAISVRAEGDTIATGGIDLDDVAHSRLRVVIPDRASARFDIVWEAVSAIDDDRTEGTLPLVGTADAATDCDATPNESSGGSLGLPLIAGATLVLGAGFVGVARRTPERV